ncbi:MAG: PSD1 and planctomycete cytochrome C domain-containing protein [Verrucomicrobiales bacterium]|nr:PSD1 and planctomycete cytochrome C domain-containing protein [Verrucomicrobiales bacterium]
MKVKTVHSVGRRIKGEGPYILRVKGLMQRSCAILCCVPLVSPTVSWAASVDYLKDIKPLLQERCYACHGALKQKKSLRLDTVTAMLKGSSDGPVIVRSEPDKSPLIQRVATTNLEDRMPPEHEGQPLTAAQIKLLRDWIADGPSAPANEKGEADPKDHWAFRKIKRPALPTEIQTTWTRNPIDAFVARGRTQQGLTPQGEASPGILLRRLSFDLIGLPPSTEEIAAVRQSRSTRWYEETVRRLLDDPRHGERWARHWMDVWRYSDPYGLGEELRNSQRHIWHFRDWIIESLNADLGYDEMIRRMLAADELYPNDLEKLRATGFLARNFYLFNRNQWLEETVEHVSKGFLGLTMNCAKCHDHKYDPIRQTEFYQMRAFFEPYQVRLDLRPGEPDFAKDAIPRVFDGLVEAPTYLFVRGQEGQPDKSTLIPPRPPKFLEFKELNIQPISLPVEAYEPERHSWMAETHLEAARKRRAAASAGLPQTRHALIDALRREADLLESADAETSQDPALAREAASLAVSEARAALNVAEAALDFAKSEITSIERRLEAMKAAWSSNNSEINERNGPAVTAERETALAKARLALAEAEKKLVKAPGDKRERINNEIKDAREAVEKARQAARAQLKPDDKFTRLPGAKWSATRFLSSTTDDPPVKFNPQTTGRRTALAGWITDHQNPLTARVAVNHIWARHFGTPLVPTMFDFGRKNAPPTNPELIDWLASELIESGWSMKHLHRLIVTSATYRMSSSTASSASNMAKDPDNLYLWRRNPIRLEAEAIRDAMLSLAGTLEAALGGPPVPPDQQADSKRRSLYFFHSGNDRNLFLATFDAAAVRECYRRDQSIVPQQALALSNSKLALDSADQIAARLSVNTSSEEGFVRRAMFAVLGIDPSPGEIAACQRALETFKSQPEIQQNSIRGKLVWALLNHNDFVTLR